MRTTGGDSLHQAYRPAYPTLSGTLQLQAVGACHPRPEAGAGPPMRDDSQEGNGPACWGGCGVSETSGAGLAQAVHARSTLYTSVCIGLYHYVSDCIVCISICICIYQFVSDSVYRMPMSRDQYPDFPFSNGNSAVSSLRNRFAVLRLENFQLAVANLRCFDASKNTPDKKLYFNWFDEHNCFIAAARRAPPYTEIFWILWLKIASNFGDSSKELIEADSSAQIDAFRKKMIKLDVQEGGDFITKVRFMTPELRAIVDTICFMAVYGHNTLFEAALKAASDNEDEFYASWKRYRATPAMPVVGRIPMSRNPRRSRGSSGWMGDPMGRQRPALLQVALRLMSRLPCWPVLEAPLWRRHGPGSGSARSGLAGEVEVA
jgi:hypothetical protein